VGNERSEEALVAITKQRKHDRLVADLTAEIMALKNTVQDREQIALKRNRQRWMMDEDEINLKRKRGQCYFIVVCSFRKALGFV
jgi:hypothetical protein